MITLSADEMRRLRRLDARSSGCLAIQNDGAMCFFGRHCQALFGYTEAQALGAQLEMLLHADDRADHPTRRQLFVTSGDSVRSMGGDAALLRGLRADGHVLPLKISIAHLARMQVAVLTEQPEEGSRELSDTTLQELDLLGLRGELARLALTSGGPGSSDAPDWEDAAGGNTLYKFTIPTKTLDTLTLTLASRTNDAAFETVTFTKLELDNGTDDWRDPWIQNKWTVIQRPGWDLGNQHEAWANWQIWSRVNRNGTVIQVHEQNSGDDNEYGKVYDIAARYV